MDLLTCGESCCMSFLMFGFGMSVGCWKQQNSALKPHYTSVDLQGSFGSGWWPLYWLTHKAFQSSGCLEKREQEKRERKAAQSDIKATDHRLAVVCKSERLAELLAWFLHLLHLFLLCRLPFDSYIVFFSGQCRWENVCGPAFYSHGRGSRQFNEQCITGFTSPIVDLMLNWTLSQSHKHCRNLF